MGDPFIALYWVPMEAAHRGVRLKADSTPFSTIVDTAVS
jgi:hypothetical protein